MSRTRFFSSIILFMFFLFPSFALSFTQSDLAGEWYIYGVASGDAPGETPRWERIYLELDAAGESVTGTTFYSSGVSGTIGPGEIMLDLSSSGIITNPSSPVDHGVLNKDSNILAYTYTDVGYHLKVGIKRERDSGTSPFQVAELEGDWRGCQIVTGDSPGEDPRCGYGDVTFNAAGGITGGTWYSFMSGATSIGTPSGTFLVDPDGMITESGNTTFHGVLSDDANLITFVNTDGGYSLFVLMRDNSPSAFDIGDLEGTWTAHAVVSGDDPDNPTWRYSTLIFDDSGNFYGTGTDPYGSGSTSGTVNLSADGSVTVSGETIYGFLSDERGLFAVINQDDGNELTFGIRGGPSQIVSGIIVNPGFETGDLFGWSSGTDGGGWIGVMSGTTSPVNGEPVPAPPEGSYAAVYDPSDPGYGILYQDFDVPSGYSSISLKATIYIENLAGVYIDGPDFEYSGVTNQKARLDLMAPTAPIDDTGAGVLANIFKTDPGDSNSITPTSVSVDLTPYAGQTVRLRLGVVATEFILFVGLDNIRIITGVPPDGGGGGGCFINSILMKK